MWPRDHRLRYHRHCDNQDDEQCRYLCFSTPDNEKMIASVIATMMVGIIRALTKRLTGFTPDASVLIFDSKVITDGSVAQSSILPILYIHIINVFRQSIESFWGYNQSLR